MSTTKLSTSLPLAMSPSTSPTSTPRTSRFTEGSPLTGSEVQNTTFLSTILFEMDEHERRRARSHRDSASSTESFMSTSSSGFSNSHAHFTTSTPSPAKENRRSITFISKRSTELVRQSMDDSRRNGNGEEKSRVGGFKGRLRALTGGRERSGSGKAYTGT